MSEKVILPFEIYCSIFSCLRLRELYSISLACKEFNEAVREIRKIRNRKTQKLIEECVSENKIVLRIPRMEDKNVNWNFLFAQAFSLCHNKENKEFLESFISKCLNYYETAQKKKCDHEFQVKLAVFCLYASHSIAPDKETFRVTFFFKIFQIIEGLDPRKLKNVAFYKSLLQSLLAYTVIKSSCSIRIVITEEFLNLTDEKTKELAVLMLLKSNNKKVRCLDTPFRIFLNEFNLLKTYKNLCQCLGTCKSKKYKNRRCRNKTGDFRNKFCHIHVKANGGQIVKTLEDLHTYLAKYVEFKNPIDLVELGMLGKVWGNM